MIWLVVAAVFPWAVAVGVVVFAARDPAALLPADAVQVPPEGLPSVLIIVPARNESRCIQACLHSLAAQDYPNFSIVVVDDRSTDGTGRVARGVSPGNAQRLETVAGRPLPEGWFGKPWACSRGALKARADLLLFTDADTRHVPTLLRSAVSVLSEDRASTVSLLGHQELGSLGERLVQPQMFTLLGLRYRKLDRPLEHVREGDAIANGQYILVRRNVYEEVGGHRAVRGEVVEDLRLAQLLVGAGHRIILRTERARFSTRMYHSLGEVLDGWTKNLAIGARQSAGRWGRLALPAIVVYVVLIWLAPPAVLFGIGSAILLGAASPGALLGWSGTVTLVGLAGWARIYTRFRVSWPHAFLYPLGAALVGFIAIRSGWRGERRVEWKGRRYSSGEARSE